MINRLSKMMYWSVLAACFVTAGCGQRYKEAVYPTEGVVVEPNVVLPGYASRAIEATGGLDRWVKTKKIELDAVVAYYKPDGSFYLTQQHHEIYPWSNSVRISALEPKGKFVWQLSNGKWQIENQKSKIPRSDKRLAISDKQMRYFAEAMLNITTAPIRFLDSEVVFTERPEPVKKEGLWYWSIERVQPLGGAGRAPPAERYWSKVVFYQNKDSSLVDMLWFVPGERAWTNEGKFVAVRGYDYRTCARDTAGAGKIEKNEVCVPTKIEIFRTNAGGILQQRMVEIDVYWLKSVEQVSPVRTGD